MIMTPGHPQFADFVDRLEGVDGCNFRKENGLIVWDCTGGRDRPLARAILGTITDVDIAGSLAYFEERGGHCDCEILFNVVPWADLDGDENAGASRT